MPARKIAGIAVHILTASGAVCGLIALHHAAAQDWAAAFLWLGAAAVVDALDGPIARKISIEQVLPRFSGARLDLVVDYLNYCAVPAYIVMESGRAGEGGGLLAGAIIVLSSLFHFADLQSKTEDGFFVGFPAIWNAVCLYFFVFDTGPSLTLGVIIVLATLTLVPVKWIHPFRVARRRFPTVIVVLIWSAAALYETVQAFPGTHAVRIIFAMTALYLIALGLARTFARDGHAGMGR